MEENQKICRILEEFTLFLLEEDKKCLNMKIKKSASKISFIFECEKISEETIRFLKEEFKIKRQESIEMYGWELLGFGDSESEIALISTLINYMTYYERDDKTYFNLVRYEEN